MADTKGMGVDVWKRLSRTDLLVDQTDTVLEIDREEVERFYHPLAISLLEKAESVSRLMVGVAGPPGSGKTAFATLLVAVINAAAGGSREGRAALVGLDGWHYPSDYLHTHYVQWGGKRVRLRSVKGLPESFDAAAAYACLSEIRQGGRVSFPVYSRKLHDPVSGGGVVEASDRIVLAEGNFLLLNEGPWIRFRRLFDVRVFIFADTATLVQGLRERHLRGGKSLAATERQVYQIDLPNSRRVASGAAYAHVLVHKADVRRVDRIELKGGTFGVNGPLS